MFYYYMEKADRCPFGTQTGIDVHIYRHLKKNYFSSDKGIILQWIYSNCPEKNQIFQ